MILNPNFYYHHGQDDAREDSPPRLLGHPSFSHQPPVGFSYSVPQHPPFQQHFTPSYPLQGPSYAQQQQPFMPQYRQPPPQARPIHPSLLNDPAFSPDPRSNPYYFSMNDREEIYPASLSDSLSDYASTAPDDESEVDHSNLPPRLRMLQSPDSVPHQLPQHPRSQSEPYQYPPIASSDQNLSRSHSTRVIPVPPPISRASASSAPFQQPSLQDPHRSVVVPSQVYASSAFVAPRDVWQPPPPYSDSESGSSSSSRSQTPASSSSHLPKDAQRSTSSLPRASAYPSEKSSPQAQPQQPPSPSAPSNSQAQAQAPPRNAPAPETQTSSVQSTASRPPITPRNASAPELHPPPLPTEVPPRPSTVPIATPTASSVSAPVAQRKRSKNTSLSAAPRDLDRIDELDESDPLGFAWHHDGPYEAIAKAAPALFPEQSASGQKRSEPSKRKPVQYDSTELGVAPGQIFPSNSQYQPPSQRDVAQLQANARGPENMPPGSPLPSSPLMQVPVKRRVPPSGVLPSSPLLYNNTHMGQMQAQQQQQQASRAQQQPAPVQSQRSRHEEAPQPSPPLPNPYSPPADSRFPQDVQNQRNSPPRTHEHSGAPPRPDLPPANAVPRPDISLPPRQQGKQPSSLLPRHLPKKLVMPTPLQQLPQPNQQIPDGRSAAHVEVLAQRHASQPPPAAPSHSRSSPPSVQSQPSSQHARAQEIPISHGPKVLRKRHTTGGVPLPMPAPQGAETPASNTTAALFAARVRFAEPPREETKEERKRREKEQARREKEREKKQQQSGGGGGVLGALFARDHVKEAEIARERELAKAQASAKASAGRKLSKRR